MFFAQVPVFGAIADVSPLVVMAVGLLCGRSPARPWASAIGLMIDTALLQTMGLSSLVLIAVGYDAGRLRDLRDPQGTLAPISLGAAAAAIATIGYGIGQFLLGVDAPAELAAGQATLSTIVIDALIAIPVVALVRRWLTPGAARGPAPPPAAGVHDRRALAAAEGLTMGAYYTPEDRRPPTTPQLALRVAALGFIALALFAIIFFRLWYLQVLAGDKYLAEANQNRVRDRADPAPRGDIVDRNGRDDRRQPAGQRRADQPALAAGGRARRRRQWGQDATTLARSGWPATTRAGAPSTRGRRRRCRPCRR